MQAAFYVKQGPAREVLEVTDLGHYCRSNPLDLACSSTDHGGGKRRAGNLEFSIFCGYRLRHFSGHRD